jgi:hypothetical protein
MTHKKIIDYPDVTEGTRIGHIARKLASKLSPEQRADQLRKAMAKIYPNGIPPNRH